MSGPAVLVVGASAAGLSTVEALRRRGHTGPVTVLGAETHPPYDRPPLSKQVLAGTWEPERTHLRSAEQLAALDARFVLGDPATRLDPAGRIVTTASGATHTADAVVVATGVVPRALPGADGVAGVHLMRTLDDTAALAAELGTGVRLVVVGEGVLGAETAATARGLGAEVTLVGPLAAPMLGRLGPLVAGELARLHTGRGVTLRLGVGVDGLEHAGGRVRGVRLAGGEVLPADVVVVAIGSTPATGWLDGSGVRLDDGVVCDEYCRAADGVYAVGDVCRYLDVRTGTHVRLENRTNAAEQAAAVAAALCGAPRPYTPLPYFWTDQYEVKVQVHGTVGDGAVCEVVEGAPADGRFVVRASVDGRVTGVVGWRMPKQTRLWRQEVVDALADLPAPGRAVGEPSTTHTKEPA